MNENTPVLIMQIKFLWLLPETLFFFGLNIRYGEYNFYAVTNVDDTHAVTNVNDTQSKSTYPTLYVSLEMTRLYPYKNLIKDRFLLFHVHKKS